MYIQKFLEDLKFLQVYKSTEKSAEYPRFGTRDFSVQHSTEHLTFDTAGMIYFSL